MSVANPPCTLPPAGWYCTRPAGHDGPCAAHPYATGVGSLAECEDAVRLYAHLLANASLDLARAAMAAREAGATAEQVERWVRSERPC